MTWSHVVACQVDHLRTVPAVDTASALDGINLSLVRYSMPGPITKSQVSGSGLKRQCMPYFRT